MATKVWQKNLPQILGHKGTKNLSKVLGERSLSGTGHKLKDKNPCPTCPREWYWLMKFKCPKSIQDSFPRFTWLQTIEDGRGRINHDRYITRIFQLPYKVAYKPTGEGYLTREQHTMFSFFDYFRKHLHDFRAGTSQFFTGGISSSDQNIWLSSNPTGAICQFHGLGISDWANLDDASVVCSRYWSMESEVGWIFSTLHTGEDGYHPVSGNRSFYIKENYYEGKKVYDLYIRGVDRLSTIADITVNSISDDYAFNVAHIFWEEVRSGIKEYVIAHGGLCSLLPHHSVRYNYNE